MTSPANVEMSEVEQAPVTVDEVTTDELVEEVSIDGMCGVY